MKSEDYKSLDKAYVELTSVIRSLEGCIHPDLVKRLKDASDGVASIMKPVWEKEEDLMDNAITGFDKIQTENKFKSVWSMWDEVSPAEMEGGKECDLQIKEIIYDASFGNNKLTHKVDKALSWLEVWNVCDKLIMQSGDLHHVFIEDLVDNGNGKFELVTGS